MLNLTEATNKLVVLLKTNILGGTLNLSTGLEDSKPYGYYVGQQVTQNCTFADIEKVYNVAKTANQLIGYWIDGYSNEFYLDSVLYIEDLDQAIEAGSVNKQIAIWDIANEEEIYLNELVQSF